MENREYEKFLESQQPAVKLELALKLAFCRDLEESKRQILQKYLRQRIRPAAALCLRRQDMETLDAMNALGWLEGADLEDCLREAGESRNYQAFLWLLRRKQASGGFGGPDLSL